MTHLDNGPGGRLPLLSPEDLVLKQQKLYSRIKANIVPTAAAAGFETIDERGHLIGPFNATLYSPDICGSFLALQKLEEETSSLSKRVRQVVILTVGAVWNAAYELYAHSAVAANIGVTDEQIDSLVSGRATEGLSPDELAAHLFTRQLVSEHKVSDGNYAVALTAFGHQGLVEMLVLVGCYLSVCALLNAFVVPVPNTSTPRSKENS